MEERLQAFIKEWNAEAGPFDGKRRSFDPVLAKADVALQEAA